MSSLRKIFDSYALSKINLYGTFTNQRTHTNTHLTTHRMGTTIGKKGGVKPKRAVSSERPKQTKKAVKKTQKEEEQLQLPSDDDESESEAVASVDDVESSDDDAEDNEDLGGFSSTDESDDEDVEEQEEEQVEASGSKSSKVESHEVKTLPKKAAAEAKKANKVGKGVIYIGRLPEGFEETELKKYFNQFGEITNVRVPRNKKTGRSKHFAFVEFENSEVAKVAQETMNNYLLLNHQLKVNIVDEEFKSSKKFKKSYFSVSKPKKDTKTLNKNADKKKELRKKALEAAGIKF